MSHNTEPTDDYLSDTIQHTTADGRTLDIPNVERLREETDGTDKYDSPETFHYWELSLNGFCGDLLESNEHESSGSELHAVSEEEQIAFKTDAPFFLLEWDSQGFVSGSFLSEEEAQRARDLAEENNGPQEGDYTMGPTGPLGSHTSVGVAGHCEGRHLGTFKGDDQEREASNAIRKDAEASQVWPNVWRISDHGNAALLRDWSWEVELSDGERFVAAFERETKGCEALSAGSCPGCRDCGLDLDSQTLHGATYKGSPLRIADDGSGSFWMVLETYGPIGVVRADTFESAWEAAEDSILADADPTDPYSYARSYDETAEEGELAEGVHYRPSGVPTDHVEGLPDLRSHLCAEDVNGTRLVPLTVDPTDPETAAADAPTLGGKWEVELDFGDLESAREIAEEPHFSRSECDTCGSTLGGDRHPAHYAYGDRKIGHLMVCVDCVFYMANGDVPETWK